MRRSAAVVVLLLTLAAVIGCAQAATQMRVSDILGDTAAPPRYSGQVTVQGIVSNATTVPPATWSNIKGEYDLTDQYGGVIHVRTPKLPPAQGVKLTVTGTIDRLKTPFELVEIPIFPWLWIALGVLGLLAIILVVLLLRKDRASVLAETAPAWGPTPVPTPAPFTPTPGLKKACPSCAAANEATAAFCESCGATLPAFVPTPTPSLRRPTDVTRVFEPIVAELLVLDGDGAVSSKRFDLTRKKQKIGRREDVEVRLADDDAVSREHAAIWCEEGDSTFYVQDLASSGGTSVNGQRVVKQALMDNDRIQVGRTKLLFRSFPGQEAK